LEAVGALGALGRSSDPLILSQQLSGLQSALKDRNKMIGIWAQVSLMALSDRITDFQLATLSKGFSSRDPHIRGQTARAVGALGDKAKSCVPALVNALHDKESMVVLEACGALVNVGDKSSRVTDALTELSTNKNTNDSVRSVAKTALEQLTNSRLAAPASK
jgi:HEAT repeat protein